MRISKWEAVLQTTQNESFKTLEDQTSPASPPPSLLRTKHDLNRSSDNLLPAHMKTSSTLELTDIFPELPEGGT